MTLRLFEGDCLSVMKDLSANSIDCFVCDLPYGCLTNQSGESKGFIRENQNEEVKRKLAKYDGAGCAWDIPIDLEAFWKEIKRLAKDEHTPVLMFCTTKFGIDLINSNPKWFRYDLVWDKQRGVSFLSANKMPMRSHEMVYVFSKAGAYYNRVDISGDFPEVKAWGKKNTSNTYGSFIQQENPVSQEGRRCAKSVIQLLNFPKKDRHPTEKPIDLYKWLIERYCPANGTILDPTAGSFNSCFAAQALGRNAIGIEKDPKFFKKAKDRVDGSATADTIASGTADN